MNAKYFDISKKIIEVNENGEQLVFLFIGREGDSLSAKLDFVHNNPNVTSNILIKAILFDNSKFNVYGNLVINTGAKNVDAYLKIDVLLMSERASAKAIPSLEITESDVKGGHGATIGPVDEEQLFYLQSRGLSKLVAERTLAEGFVQDVVEMFDENERPSELIIELDKLSK